MTSSPTKFQFDSFDRDSSTCEEDISTHSFLPHQHRGDSDPASLVREVTRLYKERYRLARTLRKMEVRVVASLRRRQGEDEDENEEDEASHEDWAGQATKARTALLEADQTTSGQELQYRLLLEDARTKSAQAATKAAESMKTLLLHQRHLVARSHSALPPERYRNEAVDALLKRQQQVLEQLKHIRLSYFSLALKKQQLEGEIQRSRDSTEDQVSIAEMLRLVVQTEAYTEEAGIQENNILSYKSATKNIEAAISKRIQSKKELSNNLTEAVEKVNSLKDQLAKKKLELKALAKRQVTSKVKSDRVEPSSRLLLDPVLMRDLKEKLELKDKLEDELRRLKQLCSNETSAKGKDRSNLPSMAQS